MTRTGIPATTYADWFRRHAVSRGTAVAIVTPEGRITYDGIHRALHAIAYRLADAGIVRGQTVGLCMTNQILQCVMIAALNRMGCIVICLVRPLTAGVAIPLPGALNIDRILVEEPFAGVMPAGAIGVHLDWLRTARERVREWTEPGFSSPDDPVHIFTSSGTTGALKAVTCSTRDLEARILKRSIGILASDRTGRSLCQFGVRSTIGFQTIFSCLWAGGTIYLGFLGSKVPRVVAQERIARIEEIGRASCRERV